MITPSTLDQVTLVSSDDIVIGSMDKIEAHRGMGQRHRAISVYLFRLLSVNDMQQVQLLIQERAATKIVGAGQWANTVCGNVRPNETSAQCALRRLREELGIGTQQAQAIDNDTQLHISPLYTFEYHLQCNREFSEWEIDQVFVGWYQGEVAPNPLEAQDAAWVDWGELLETAALARKNFDNFHTKDITLDLSDAASSESTNKTQITLAPWFVYMLDDTALINLLNTFVADTAQ